MTARSFCLLLGLLVVACTTPPDYESPSLHFICPGDGDTLQAGVVILRAVATDNQTVEWVSFWVDGEMLGITKRRSGDTFSMGWDCSTDTGQTRELGAEVTDKEENHGFDDIMVYVRR